MTAIPATVHDEAVEARILYAVGLGVLGFDVLSLWSTRPDGTCRCPAGAGCIQKPGKHPIAPDGTWQETHDPALIRTLLSAASHPNYGVIPPPGVFGWDVDGEAGPRLADLAERLGPLPASYGHETPNGRHVFYRWPLNVDRPAGGNLFGIVTRWPNADKGRGYLVGPYSRIGAKLYRPVGDPHHIAELPEAWARAASDRDREPRLPFADVPKGERHVALRDAAYFLHKRGLTGDALRAAVDAINAALPEPKTADDVSRAIGDVERFPIDDDVTGAEATVSPQADVPSGRNLSELFTTPVALVATLPAMVECAWSRFLFYGAVHELVGAAKASGKTTLLAYLMASMLDGRPFLEQPTTAGPIVFLTEQPTASLRAVLERSGLASRTDLRVLLWRDTRGSPWPEIVAAAVAECSRVGARVLIVDTLPAFAGIRGDAENDAGAALAAIEPLQVAAADGLAVVVVRHERKGGGEVGESGRGSSAFTGAVDVVLRLARQPNAARPTIRILSTLSRFDETPPELVVELTERGYIALGDVAAVAFDEARRGVLDALAEARDGLTEGEIAERVGGAKSTTGAALRNLLVDGAVVRSGEGKRGSPYRYAIGSTDSGFVSPDLRKGRAGESNSSPRTGGDMAPPVDLWADASRIFADDLEPEAVDDAIAAQVKWTEATA